jgi:hypothetical protein
VDEEEQVRTQEQEVLAQEVQAQKELLPPLFQARLQVVEETPQAQHVLVAPQAPLEVEMEPQGWCFEIQAVQDSYQDLLEEDDKAHEIVVEAFVPHE